MILSYHPIFQGDENRLCAGRLPDSKDRAAMRRASAVILPQGVYRSLYEMARESCPLVFPGQDRRFSHPGKTGQAKLLAAAGVPHPETEIFSSSKELPGAGDRSPRPFPFVLKLDWGGEGRNVFCVDSQRSWRAVLDQIRRYEATGQKGFVVQELIPAGGRSLRVAVIGRHTVAYWRVRLDGGFPANLSRGAVIDKQTDPHLMAIGAITALDFCHRQGIDLAGLDFLFRCDQDTRTPLFLEINWVFGREGLGGAEGFYSVLVAEIHAWLAARGLAVSALSG